MLANAPLEIFAHRAVRVDDRDGTRPALAVNAPREGTLRRSSVAALELAHERSQSDDSRKRHGVVEARAHPARQAVPAQIRQPRRRRRAHERILQRRLGEAVAVMPYAEL